jgi:pyruvate/2-oxoacid:ferredoxin oxidoreductase alpha subunit
MKKVLLGNEAAALAAKLAKVQVVAAYPITPQTVIVEELANMVGRGELQAKFLSVESEHSAMASCIGACAAGARVFTATSSQGLALMHEVLHYAAGARLPIVMVNANRSLSPPWNLYCDHTDSLAQRDTGWIQYYCLDVQDVLDSILIAYRVAEQVLLPVMINMDGFYLTHTSEVADVPDPQELDRYLGSGPVPILDIENPATFGNVAGSDLYPSLKCRRQKDSLTAADIWRDAAELFDRSFGRFHPPVEAYRTQDADAVIVNIGTAAGAARLAVDRLREKGFAAGSLRLCMFRPFPKHDFLKSLPSKGRLIVIDRDVSFGAEGIVAQEVKAALYERRGDFFIEGYIAGIGGNDITPEGIMEMVCPSGPGNVTREGDSIWVEVLR